MMQGLAERILPARGAAQKASASFAGQLTDSPGRSDGDSPSSANPFHEPAHRTTSVKYRYSATGKHLSSPLKGSHSSPERKPDKPKLKGTTAPSAHAAKAKAPAVASTSRKRKISAASLRKEDGLNSGFHSSMSPLSSPPTSPILSTNDLPPFPASTSKEPAPSTPKRLPISHTLSLRSLGPTTSKFSVLSQPLSRKRKQRSNSAKGGGVWEIGNLLWVLVDQHGVLASISASLEASEQLMWWPARVVQSQPLRVLLFGDFPSSTSTSRGLCTIFDPSSSDVLSINDDSGSKRFSRTSFRLTSLSANGDVSPPAKKRRLDETTAIEARWESAVQSMEKASTLEKDGLPALLSSYATSGNSFYDSLDDGSDPDTSGLLDTSQPKPTESTGKLKPQRSRANLGDDTSASVARAWSPCPPDPTLQIPGELVLALAPRTGGSYWPAKLLQHVPDRKEKYLVKFLDDEEHVVARDRFWTSEEEGFVLCTLGEWESTIKTTDDPDSGDEVEEYGADDGANTYDGVSALPPPPPAEDFEDLSVRAQLAYVKPVLRAILSKEYAPTREKHEGFMKGGSARLALLKSAGVRGGMDVRFVKAMQKAICEWVLGGRELVSEGRATGDAVAGTNGKDEGAITQVISSDVVPGETLPHNPPGHEMEGVEGMVAPEDASASKDSGTQNGALPLSTPDKHAEGTRDSEAAVDRQEQQPVALPPTNGLILSPAVQHASLVAKSQLDLLAEVSQAVATEPSLLPSHPEIPRLKVDLPHKDMSPQPSPLTPIADEDQSIFGRSSPVVCTEFEALSGVEKLDYCLNLLLPECILQLLLWRSGERTSSVLLSPEEEQRLRDVATRKAAETDWVDDLMRLRAAQARLWDVDLSKKAEEKNAPVQGGTRSRPRKETISRR